MGSGDRRAIRIFAFAREPQHLYLEGYFTELATRHNSLSYQSIFTRAVQPSETSPRTMIAACVSRLHDWSVHIAGPAGFVTSMSEMMLDLGCDDVLADKF